MSKSEDLKKTLTSAKTGRKELDELAHYIGEQLDENTSPLDVAYCITETLIAVFHGKDKPQLPAVRGHVTSEKKCLELGASLFPYIQQHAPEFAEKYAEYSRLFFGKPTA
ncbi:hypothetical protein IKP94_04155 [Candidatus Saccharibacteria bacterium]|nr:hypothetical protein [Candidatus Saccharibacteria bacterium]